MLTIDRPERRNAVDAETAELLLDGYRRFEADDEARVLVLTGEGPEAFCAGADLKAIAEARPGRPPSAIESRRIDAPEGPMGFTRLTPTKPTIAAISGWCLAGGLELALWCDLRIATETARLGFPERRWGVPLIDGGTQRLPRIVGHGPGARHDPHRPISRPTRRSTGGSSTRSSPRARTSSGRSSSPRGSPHSPRPTMLSDRRAAIEGFGLPMTEGLELEAELGRASVETGVAGATRFAAGEGRGGEGAGV